jgi:hypothetical protein
MINFIFSDAKIKAILTTIVFASLGVVSSIYLISNWSESLPLVIFYFILIVNTFFSIKLFSAITPDGVLSQAIMDIFLFFIYLALLISINSQLLFVFFTLLLFILAIMKYTLLLGIVDHPKLLKRKILIDLSGALGSALVLGGILFGDTILSTWIFTGGFAFANVLLFFVWPMYRPDYIISSTSH